MTLQARLDALKERHAALLAAAILATSDAALATRLDALREQQTNDVADQPA